MWQASLWLVRNRGLLANDLGNTHGIAFLTDFPARRCLSLFWQNPVSLPSRYLLGPHQPLVTVQTEEQRFHLGYVYNEHVLLQLFS